MDVQYVQLRDKTMSAGDLAQLARVLLADLPGSIRLLINGRADVAAAVGAAGVHLASGPDELTPGQVCEVYRAANLSKAVISIACHTIDEVERARDDGADLLLFSPVFEKRVSPAATLAGTGLEALRAACLAARSRAVLALGGVTLANAPSCIEAGAAGVAGIRLFASELVH